jgi:hypothetical protein
LNVQHYNIKPGKDYLPKFKLEAELFDFCWDSRVVHTKIFKRRWNPVHLKAKDTTFGVMITWEDSFRRTSQLYSKSHFSTYLVLENEIYIYMFILYINSTDNMEVCEVLQVQVAIYIMLVS